MTDTHKPAPPPSFPPGRGLAPKPGLDGKGDMHDPKKAGRQHRRNLASPCDRPPATPTGVAMRFRAVEAKTHLNFKGRIVWDDVLEDTSGFPINTVDRWDIEWRALDDDGDPVEVEHSALRSATNPSGSNFHYKTTRAISPDKDGGFEWHVGDRVKIRGCYPETNYNGTFTITSIPDTDEFVVDGGHSGESDANRVGEVYNLSTSQSYRRKLRNPQPRMPLRSAHMLVDTSDHHNINDIRNPSGTTYRISVPTTHDVSVNDYIKVENVGHNPYNGIWKVTSIVDADTFEVAGDTSGLANDTSGDYYQATTIFEFTTRGTNGFNSGDSVRVTGNRPEVDYNGTYTITSTPGDDVFRVQPNHHPDDQLLNAETLGVVYDNTDALHLLIHHVPRPKSWSWQARVRCRSGEGCWSAFSPWTDAILPWDGADPQPPVPTYGATPITFDHKGKGKHRKIRLLFTFDEVEFWDVPGGDREDDVAEYVIQLDQSTDGVNWDGTRQGGTPYRTHHRNAKDGDADSTVVAVFNEIHRHYWYRVRVRTKDRFGRRGDWSEWTDAALPFDDAAPPTPENVEVFPQSTDRVVVAWDDPLIDIPCVGTVTGTSGSATLTGTGTMFHLQIEGGTLVKVDGNTYTVKKVTSPTALTLTSNLSTSPAAARLYEVAEDPDVAFYAVQLAKFADVDLGASPNEWSGVYARDRVEGTRKAFKIPDADVDETFFARVRSVDAARNRSVWIPAWDTTQHSGSANSDPDVDGDGVVVIPGAAGVTAEWSWPRRLDEDETLVPGSAVAPYEIPQRFENLTGSRLWFKKATMVCGDREAGTGDPSGADIIVQLRRWETDDVTNDNLLHISAPDHRLTIAAGTWHAPSQDTFEVTHLDPGESVSATVVQYGSIDHGRDLFVQLLMSPAAPVQH